MEEIPNGHYVEFEVVRRGGGLAKARVHGNEVIEALSPAKGWVIVNEKKHPGFAKCILTALFVQWDELTPIKHELK